MERPPFRAAASAGADRRALPTRFLNLETD
jgi:hypothetical protein